MLELEEMANLLDIKRNDYTPINTAINGSPQAGIVGSDVANVVVHLLFLTTTAFAVFVLSGRLYF